MPALLCVYLGDRRYKAGLAHRYTAPSKHSITNIPGHTLQDIQAESFLCAETVRILHCCTAVLVHDIGSNHRHYGCHNWKESLFYKAVFETMS